ncbi:MAG TPA: nucleoside phosphorylase [Clostridiales bacterium]|nr:nucleoside phosphorylase [Clostridiales bacterium]HOL91372.1 nucleoside phosphorylase [Clostridiales bacterium]HPP35744.1 nucleoside phosphorylase [Clostridiales bacterium]
MDGSVPFHINAEKGDFEGNGGHGRYVLLPGSEGRAEKIASMWKDVAVKKHPRNHNLYLGRMESGAGDIDMAVISTGMGAPSADIIINELLNLGARNLIRIGTSGSMQPERVPAGSVVVPTGSVKDESVSARYLPVEMPAVPSLEFLTAALRAWEETGAAVKTPDNPESPEVFFGVVHSKDSFYAREMLVGPKRLENEEYMRILKDGGVLASEMETSILFTLGQVYSQQFVREGDRPVLTGAVLAVVGGSTPFAGKAAEASAIDAAISFCLKTVEVLHRTRMQY